MRKPSLLVVGLAGVLALLVTPVGQVAAAPSVVADWEMNEPAGATTMVDSSGNGHDGVIGSDAAAEGLTSNGSVYQWSLRCPTCLPVAPARVITVPDSPSLDIPDPTVPYTIQFRFKTHKGYGNIMQKGQGTTAGGQIKIENPKGYTSCVFLGANGNYVSVRGTKPLNDGIWHTVTCLHTARYVAQTVDGVEVGRKNRRTGPIDNAKPFTIGGKPSCNQVKVTCDYYSGYVDYVKITHG
jgi:hypothetical protein